MPARDQRRFDDEMEKLVLENHRLSQENEQFRRIFSLTAIAKKIFSPKNFMVAGLAVGAIGGGVLGFDSIGLAYKEAEVIQQAVDTCANQENCNIQFDAVSSPVFGRELGPYYVQSYGTGDDVFIGSTTREDGTIVATQCHNVNIELRRLSDGEVLRASENKLCL